jgi:hypothetical protein
MTAALDTGEPITVALIPKAAADLARLQDRTELSKTDLINRAITLYEFATAMTAAGWEIRVHDTDGGTMAVKLL